MAGVRRDDDGSMSVELAVLALPLVVLLNLFVVYGRYTQATGLMESTVRDAARAATQQHDVTAVDQVARDVVSGVTFPKNTTCQAADVSTDQPGNTLAAGAMLTVSLTCRVGLGDLGLNRTLTVSRSFTSPIDPYVGLH